MISKIKAYVYSLICCSLFVMSCTSNDDLLENGSDFFVLQCDKSQSWSNSRAAMDENGVGSFVNGDRVELMIGNKVLQSEYISGQWKPELKRSDFPSGELKLSALFPVLTSNGANGRNIVLPVDQSFQENQASADILYASTVIGSSETSALLRFRHALHRICINLKGNVSENIQVEVSSVTEGSISLETGEVSLSDNAVRKWIKPLKTDQNAYTAIILPQDATPYHDGEGFIRLTLGDKIVYYPLDENISSFDKGMQTTINLTLKSSETGDVDSEFSNQTRWVYGITAPVFPGKENVYTAEHGKQYFDDGLWIRYANEKMSLPIPEEQYLTWEDGAGWFDCNKTFEYVGDGNMCWAAAASNLIHWWMVQNQKYIEAYDKEYGPEYVGIVRPEKYSKMTEENQQHSEVFNFFKSSFRNLGSWDTGGVNWFINGNTKILTSSQNPDFHGFFSKVFTKNDAVAKETRDTSKENFNLWIKDAFRNNQAIGFAAYDFAGPRTKSHSMVIWGAEFDAEGNVAFVYFCDNNYSKDEPNHASLKRFKVVYDKTDIPELKGDYAYISTLDNTDGTPSESRFRFTSLTLVDLRQDIWQKFFPKVQ